MNIQRDNTKRAFDMQLRNLVSDFKRRYGTRQAHCQIDNAVSLMEEKLFPYLNSGTCPVPGTVYTAPTNTLPVATTAYPVPTAACPIPTTVCPPTNDCPPCRDDFNIKKALRNVSTSNLDFETDSYSLGNWNNLIREVMNNIEKDNGKSEIPLLIYPENYNKPDSSDLATRLEKCFGINK